MYIIYYLSLFLSVMLISCNSDVSSINKNSVLIVNQESIDSNNTKSIKGFFLNTFNQSGVLVIYNNKIHHFNKNEFDSFVKDEEYDFNGIDSDNYLVINKKYRLDRNNNHRE